MPILSRYKHLIDNNILRPDAQQSQVANKLQALYVSMMHAKQDKNPWMKKFAFWDKENKPAIKGLYIYGDVGRGKTMLMDLFFEQLTSFKKRRAHFHAFMQEVHKWLYAQRETKNKKNSDLLPLLAKEIANEIEVLCFDEMEVHDITDAMIVGRLFSHILEEGVVLVVTSNRIPDDLYKNGLQREQFIPFIALLKSKLDVVELRAEHDYRLVQMKSLKTVYYSPHDKNAYNYLEQSFLTLTHQEKPTPTTLIVHGREIVFNKTYGDILFTSFARLCETHLGPADYLEIAQNFSTIILENIPKLSAEKRNEARRFVMLIDALYEHKVKLICSAEVAPNALYTDGHGAFEFDRTVSRLIEMQSEKYLALKRSH